MGIKYRMYVVGAIGTNCYLVWDDASGEAMLIDPGAYDPAVARAITENALILRYIALTHGHFDHTTGVREFMAEFPEAVFAASAKESGLLEALIPELDFSEDSDIKLGESLFRVIETPGHTPGGVCFYIDDWDEELIGPGYSGTLFSGDTLFHSSVGRTDLQGGDMKTLLSSIREKLLKLPGDTIVLPGHMDVTTIGNEKQYNPFVG